MARAVGGDGTGGDRVGFRDDISAEVGGGFGDEVSGDAHVHGDCLGCGITM